MHALILDGQVIELADTPFPVAPPLAWHECDDQVQPGWSHGPGGFSAPPAQSHTPTIGPVEKLRAFLAANPDVATLIQG